MNKVLRMTLSVVWVGAMSLGGRSCCSSSDCGGGGSSGCTIDLSTPATRSVGDFCLSSPECFSGRCFEGRCVSGTCGFRGEPCCAEGCRGRSFCNDAGNVCDPCDTFLGPSCPTTDASPVEVDGSAVLCGMINTPCCNGTTACAQPLTCMTVAAPPDASDDADDGADVAGDADADAGKDDAGDADPGDDASDASDGGGAGIDAGDVDAAADAGDAEPADASADVADAPRDVASEPPAMTLRVCLSCGGDGQPCCERRCAEHLACERDDAGLALCSPCGLRGEPCCAGARCEFGARCTPLDDGFDRCVPADRDGGNDAPDGGADDVPDGGVDVGPQ
jgi:hypothetical protein